MMLFTSGCENARWKRTRMAAMLKTDRANVTVFAEECKMQGKRRYSKEEMDVRGKQIWASTQKQF